MYIYIVYSLLISKCQDYDKTISELKDQVSSIETEKVCCDNI